MKNDIKVSVICCTYNHENYIRKALDGFIMQKTNFKFEVLVHDDASTDNTSSIIREYEEKYPDIIKPVYQTENQYSQGVKISKTYLYPLIQGEYVAFCEGDDSWTDPYKLQKQVDFLDSHIEYSACVHVATFKTYTNGQTLIIPNIKTGREYSIDEIIKGGGNIFATASMVCRSSYNDTMPPCFFAKWFGDYQKFIYLATVGKIWCMSDNMSLYNSGVPGSWTARIWNNVEKRIAHHQEMIEMLSRVDKYYEGRYHSSIAYKIAQLEMFILVLLKDKKSLKTPKYKEHYKRYKSNIIKSWILKHFPFIAVIKRKFFSKRY